ncbi:MAG: hypothetical protein QM760_09655 [Nibricoccus sp.]
MRLSHRPARPDDFSHCFDLMCEAHAYEPALRRQIPKIWTDWLAEGVFTADVIEDHVPGKGTRPVGLGASVCVSDAFAAELVEKRGQPFARAELTRRHLAGEKIVLNREEMRAANRDGGLNLFFINDAVSHLELTDEQRLESDAEWGEALSELRGCHIKSMFLEIYGVKKRTWCLRCGLLPFNDYEAHWEKNARSLPPEDRQPFLMGLRREDALRTPGTHASFLFMHVPPQFGFSTRQQELLRNALDGSTDDDLSEQLNVSASGIKKRWISIYDQVSSTMPGWLERGAENAAARGSEKRRHLLNYLRQRPEELHPACASRE